MKEIECVVRMCSEVWEDGSGERRDLVIEGP